jgi:hypothetical protein
MSGSDKEFIKFNKYEKDGKAYMDIQFDHTNIKTVGFELIKDFLGVIFL